MQIVYDPETRGAQSFVLCRCEELTISIKDDWEYARSGLMMKKCHLVADPRYKRNEEEKLTSHL